MEPDLFAPLAPDPRPGDEVAVVLVVCHANITRSPFAAALLEARVHQRLGVDAPVWIRSAGVHARDGLPADAGSRLQAGRRGLDLSRHRSALLTPQDVVEADLVVTMTEAQRTHAVHQHPAAARWTFTLPELARLCASLSDEVVAGDPRTELRATVRRLADLRPRVTRPDGPEDVADPHGGPDAGFAYMAEHVERAVDVVAARLFRPYPGTGTGDG